jgi:flagellar biosynthesis/type III secretory pathway M-ring protein FliF/YscJ
VNGAPSSMVSPGLWGFVAFFVLAIALYLLMRNMNARMRRMSYRSEELAREAQAEADERKARKQGDEPKGDEPKGDAPEDPEQTGDTNP